MIETPEYPEDKDKQNNSDNVDPIPEESIPKLGGSSDSEEGELEDVVFSFRMSCLPHEMRDYMGVGTPSIFTVIINMMFYLCVKHQTSVVDLKDVIPFLDINVEDLLELCDCKMESEESKVESVQWLLDTIDSLSQFMYVDIISINGDMSREIPFFFTYNSTVWKTWKEDEEPDETWIPRSIRIYGGSLLTLEGDTSIITHHIREIQKIAIEHENLEKKLMDIWGITFEELQGNQPIAGAVQAGESGKTIRPDWKRFILNIFE